MFQINSIKSLVFIVCLGFFFCTSFDSCNKTLPIKEKVLIQKTLQDIVQTKANKQIIDNTHFLADQQKKSKMITSQKIPAKIATKVPQEKNSALVIKLCPIAKNQQKAVVASTKVLSSASKITSTGEELGDIHNSVQTKNSLEQKNKQQKKIKEKRQNNEKSQGEIDAQREITREKSEKSKQILEKKSIARQEQLKKIEKAIENDEFVVTEQEKKAINNSFVEAISETESSDKAQGLAKNTNIQEVKSDQFNSGDDFLGEFREKELQKTLEALINRIAGSDFNKNYEVYNLKKFAKNLQKLFEEEEKNLKKLENMNKEIEKIRLLKRIVKKISKEFIQNPTTSLEKIQQKIQVTYFMKCYPISTLSEYIFNEIFKRFLKNFDKKAVINNELQNIEEKFVKFDANMNMGIVKHISSLYKPGGYIDKKYYKLISFINFIKKNKKGLRNDQISSKMEELKIKYHINSIYTTKKNKIESFKVKKGKIHPVFLMNDMLA